MDTKKLKEGIWRIADGIPLRLESFTIKIADNGRLSISGWTGTHYFENITKNNIAIELIALKDDFRKLANSFPELLSLINANNLEIEFHMHFDDSGKASIGLCSEIDGRLEWYI